MIGPTSTNRRYRQRLIDATHRIAARASIVEHWGFSTSNPFLLILCHFVAKPTLSMLFSSL